MSLVNSALQIGRSALMSYQSALQVLGNNVSNAGNPDYTRQSAGLSSLNGISLPEGFRPGAGVALTSLQRNLDEALEQRLRISLGNQQAVQAEDRSISQIEVLFDELTGVGLAGQMSAFFNAMTEVNNDPADTAIRSVAVAEGAALASSLRGLRSELIALGVDADSQISTLVEQANGIAQDLARLNTEIVAAEAGGRAPASALRDQRDAQLRELAEIVDVDTRIQPDGSLYVFIGSEALIQGGVARSLKTEQELNGEFSRTAVRFEDSGADVSPRGGALLGLITARDEHAYGGLDRLDQLAGGLIADVNRVHSEGQGLVGFTSLTGTVRVDDTTAALNSTDAGLGLAPQNGSFFLVVTDDSTGTPVAYQIDIDLDGTGTDATLDSVVAQINATVTGVTASVTVDNNLRLDADAGRSFTFGYDGQLFREDTSDALAALGINTLFTGADASDIQVNSLFEGHPELLAAGMVNLPGDGGNAARLAELDTAASAQLGDVSILDFYNNIVGDVAVSAATVHSSLEATSAVAASLQSEKEAISGVSLDEEAIDLLKYERAFQGAARYISVVDQLMDEMLALAR
ncbi:MAG: flagellar hook-associated protein FlgK [bacterium]|nr:flagellar hook-associated protein FlgK [bacterium]